MPVYRALAALALVIGTIASGVLAGAPIVLALVVGYLVFLVVVSASARPWGGRFANTVPLDAMLAARVREMARSMGIPAPAAAVLPGQHQAEAYVFSILFPIVVIGEGVVHRLPPAERDAIVAHELGHIATGSWWVKPATAAAAGSIGLVAMAATGAWESLLAAVPVWIVGRRVVQRGFECRCDLAGARVVGFATMANALHRIHGIRDGAGVRFLRLLDATSSHPGVAVRREYLRARAPAEERDRIPAAPAGCVRTARLCSALWAATAAVGIAAGIAAGPIGAALFLVVAEVPLQSEALLVSGMEIRALRRLGRRPIPTAVRFAAVLGAAIAGTALVPAAAGDVAVAAWLVLGGIRRVAAMGIGRRFEHGRLAAEGRFAEIVRRADRVGSSSSAEGAAEIGLCQAAAGDLAGALARLDRAAARHPRVPYVRMVRARLRVEADPEAAVEDGRALARELPGDPWPWVVVALAAHRLGQPDLLASASSAALAADPRDFEAHAVAALASAVRGDAAAALSHLDEAERLAPGAAKVAVARAEALVALAHPDAPEATTAARAAAERDPLALLGLRVERLPAPAT